MMNRIHNVLFLSALAIVSTTWSHAFVLLPSPTTSRTVATNKGPAFASPGLLWSRSSSTVTTTCRDRSRLWMAWGPEPIWSSGKVTKTTEACTSGLCVSVLVEVDPDVAKDYIIPGQYVQIRLEDDTKPLFLAMANAPPSSSSTTNQFEFLIKKTEFNDWLTAAPEGTTLQVSQVLGGGFPVAENLEGFKYDFPTQNVLFFAVGSGIAPIKAAMESSEILGSSSSTFGPSRTARLYYGVQTPDDLCFVDHFAKWEERGIQVVPVLSQPPDDWQGRSGYVQNALEEDGVPIPRNSGALLCGMKGMTESVKDLLLQAGVFEGRVLTNF